MSAHVRDQVASLIREFEGGLADHAADTGGLTMYGLTFAVFKEERPRGTEAQFRALTREDVVEIIGEKYGLKPGYARIQDDELRLAVIDYAIHSHPFNATKALQRAAGVAIDGQFGPATEAAVNRADPNVLLARVLGYRLRLWARIFRRNKTQRVFAAGWLNRAATLLERAA